MSEITAQDSQEAADALRDQLDSWATDDDVRELYAVRPKMATTETTPQDATNVQRNWNIALSDTGEVIDRVSGASLSQAEAVLNDTARRFNVSPDDLSLRSTGVA